MASPYPSSDSSSADRNIMWEHGDGYTDYDPHSSQCENNSPLSSTPIPPSTSQPTTPGLTSPMTSMLISSQSPIFFPESSTETYFGRPKKKARLFRGNQHTKGSSQDSSISALPTPRKRKRLALKLSKRGYCSFYSTPKPSKTRSVTFKANDDTVTSKRAGIPTGMRIMDVGILSEAMTKLKCTACSSPLSLYETDFTHGWHTTFSIKCFRCHLLVVEFPSSKPMDVPNQSSCINVQLPERSMNEVTMRSVFAVHCSGFSWRNLHKLQPCLICQLPLPECLHDI